MLRGFGLRKFAIALVATVGTLLVTAGPSAAASSQQVHIDCAESSLCAEVANYKEGFGPNYYVGHDEPSALFYSNQPGSGNHLRYTLRLPADPSPANPNTPGKSYNFELAPTFWFGMALCDTQSYPEQVSSGTPDSDSNITSSLAKHPGTAFTELQFYPPGWVPWPTWAVAPGATTCDPTRWCAAMNVFTLLEDPDQGHGAERLVRHQGRHRDVRVRVRHARRALARACQPARRDARHLHAGSEPRPAHELG